MISGKKPSLTLEQADAVRAIARRREKLRRLQERIRLALRVMPRNTELARRFGVSPSTIGYAIQRECKNHEQERRRRAANN